MHECVMDISTYFHNFLRIIPLSGYLASSRKTWQKAPISVVEVEENKAKMVYLCIFV
jgi:hypothetical protein